jgi:SAM-dependent methyltransferase
MAILSKYLQGARLAMIKPYLKGDILDLGCANARVLRDYGSRISHYCGIERSPKKVKRLKKEFPDACFHQCDLDADRLPVDRQYDCILMTALIEHLFNQKHVMTEVKRVLKPEGVILITTPTVFGNDIVLRLGATLGLFAKSVVDNHIVIYNRHRFIILARKIGLELRQHRTFQLFCNQIAVLGINWK